MLNYALWDILEDGLLRVICYTWTRLHFCAGHLARLPVTKEIFIQFEGRVRLEYLKDLIRIDMSETSCKPVF